MDLQALQPLASTLALGWAFAAVVMGLLWLRMLSTRNATSVDVAWAANLGFLAVGYALLAWEAGFERRVLVAVLGSLWSARLVWHLAKDRLWQADGAARGEDGRYADLRRRWGKQAPVKFFLFYQFQAALDAFLSLPFALALSARGGSLGGQEIAAALLWLAALTGESVADRQLARFKLDPKNRGRTCREGLWRLSRHPNYFFEWLSWCAFALLASGTPLGLLAWSAPALMLYLILFVTGIPPTEEQALRSRGEDYRAYQRSTSAFVPWFPKKESAACGTNP